MPVEFFKRDESDYGLKYDCPESRTRIQLLFSELQSTLDYIKILREMFFRTNICSAVGLHKHSNLFSGSWATKTLLKRFESTIHKMYFGDFVAAGSEYIQYFCFVRAFTFTLVCYRRP